MKSLFQTTHCPVAFFYCTIFRLTSIPSDCVCLQQNAALIRSELVLTPETAVVLPVGLTVKGQQLEVSGVEQEWRGYTGVQMISRSCSCVRLMQIHTCTQQVLPQLLLSGDFQRSTCKKHNSPQGAKIEFIIYTSFKAGLFLGHIHTTILFS